MKMDSGMLYGETYTSSWKALPIDGSESAWEAEIGATRFSISRALQALEEDVESHEKSLLYQIKQPKSKKFIDENGVDTHPARLYWEVKPLISALVRSKKSASLVSPSKRLDKDDTQRANKNANKQDVFADKIFCQLALDLSEKDHLEDHFAQVMLVGDTKVREHMVQIFQSEIALRLEAVRRLTSYKLATNENSNGYMETAIIQNVLAACQAIDVLIDRLLYTPCTDQPIVSPVTSEDISALYEELVAERKRITTYGLSGEDITTKPVLLNTPENQDIIRQLDQAFDLASQFSKNTPLSPESRSQLETAFERYLLATIPAEKKARVKNFSQNYSSIKKFLQHEHDFEKYKLDVQNLLVKYVKELFADVQEGNMYPYAYNPHEPKSINDMFLGENIKNVQQNISYKIHRPLQCLCKLNILECYAGMYLEEKLSELITQICDIIRELASQYPNLPLGDYPAKFPVEEFVDCYNRTVVPILNYSPLNFEKEEDQRERLSIAQISVGKLPIKHMLLHICELIAVYEIERSVIEIQGNYEVLTSFYNGITS